MLSVDFVNRVGADPTFNNSLDRSIMQGCDLPWILRPKGRPQFRARAASFATPADGTDIVARRNPQRTAGIAPADDPGRSLAETHGVGAVDGDRSFGLFGEVGKRKGVT